MQLRILISLFLITIIYPTNGQHTANLFGNMEFGSYAVGIKQLMFVNDAASQSRKISINLWYPAKKSKTNNLKFADYLNYKKQFKDSELYQELSARIGGDKNLFPNDSLEVILNATMKASKNSKEVKGRFPLLIWSSRYETVEYQCLLSEYLASHGYIVAFAEDLPNSPYPWQLQTAGEKENRLNQHVSDINASINFLKSRKNVDKNKIGILSWSYAGESAILTQMNNPDVDLVIGLSAIGFTSGVYLGEDLSQKIDIKKINVPYLILSERTGTNGKVRTPPEIFNAMNPASRHVSFTELSHGNFNSIEGMIPGIIRTEKVQSWSRGGEIAQLGYETICNVTLLYLETTFKHNTSRYFDESVSLLIKDLPSEFISVSTPSK